MSPARGTLGAQRRRPAAPGRGTQDGDWPGTVLWAAPLLNFSGYGEEARGFVAALAGAGAPVTACPVDVASPELTADLATGTGPGRALQEALARPVEDPTVAVLHVPGSALGPVAGAVATVGRTMFETDGLPASWVPRLNTMDEIWVPASFNVETFHAAGVTAPLQVVPGGVDTVAFRPGRRPLAIPGLRGTVFLSVFEWSYRKGYDVLLAAWAEAFDPKDPVSLVLRAFPRSRWHGDAGPAIDALLDEQLAGIGRSRADVAPIVVLGRPLGTAQVPALMTAADVYVSPSRGEGWGRPYLEAMSCGLAVIGTRWSGNLDFMDETNSALLDVEALVPVDERMDAATYLGQRWAEPSRAHLVALMRELAANPRLRRSLGGRARRHAAQVAAGRLRQLAGGPRPIPLGPRPPAARAARAEGGPEPAAAAARAEGGAEPAAAAARAAAGRAAGKLRRVRWVGDVFADHSLAIVNRELCSRLAGRPGLGVEVATTEDPGGAGLPDELAPVPGAGLVPPGLGPVAVEVRHQWPPDFRPPGDAAWVMIQPWEFGGLPAEWIAALRDQVDEVWVPTTWVRECYLRSGVPPEKVVVVPNGVDVGTFTPVGPRRQLATTASFRFLFVGGTLPRKGADLLLEAYLDTFTAEDDVCLVVKPFGADTVYRGSNLDDRFRAAAADPGLPAIEIVAGRLTRPEMAELYRACQVLVHPYRGEGFALPVAEAMACGLPVVVTGYGACLDYCDDRVGWLLPATEVPVTLAGFTPGPAGHWWAEPDPVELRRLLRLLAGSPELVAQKGAAAAARIPQRLSWDRAADLAAARLAALASSGAPAVPTQGGPLQAGPTQAGPTRAGPTQEATRMDEHTPAQPRPQGQGQGRLPDPAAADLQAQMQALATLTSQSLGLMKSAVEALSAQVAGLSQPGSHWPLPAVPPELTVPWEDGQTVIGYRDGSRLAESDYVAFEDVFRGPEEVILQRQQAYLPFLAAHAPVLDLGCGRGEMLRLLRTEGIAARGVDADPGMVRRCLQRDLPVVEAEALSHLRGLPDGCLGAVFTAQLIEHLPQDLLADFLAQCHRVLAPEGVLIAETVNPHCPMGLKNFWLDLTHRNPIFPEVAVLLCRQAGFQRARTLLPGGSGSLSDDLVGCPDYAVVAYKAPAASPG